MSPQKKRPPRKTSASNSKRAQRKKINRYVRICGRILFILQVIISLIMLFTVGRTGMLPWKYMVLIFAVLALLAAVTFMLNLKRNRKVRLTGIGISTVVIIFVLVFTRYFNRTMGLISSGDNAQKTDNMVVVVRANDPAEVLMDAKEYKFAVHGASSGASGEMISDVESAISSKIKVEEYSSDVEAARALLEGKADAAIYNKYGDISQTSRSDVNIIVTVNPKTKKVLLTSTPRDYYVPIPEVSDGVRDKLTHAGIYGVDASMRTLEELYGIDITYFVRVNFDTLIKLVDAMDGLDVYVEYPFDAYTDEYHFDKGWHDMFGDQVLAFCRERYSYADGDNQRGRNQEQVLKALIEKLISPAILPHYAEILDSLDGFFQMNIPQEKIAELVNMQLTDNAHWDIMKQSAEQGESALETTYSAGSTPLYIMWPDDASVKVNTARIEMIMSEGYTTNTGSAETVETAQK